MRSTFKIGDTVVMWHHNGAGIYDGNTVYVRAINNGRYGLSDINEGNPVGWMDAKHLMSANDFKQLVQSRTIGQIWKGDIDKLSRIYQRYEKEGQKQS